MSFLPVHPASNLAPTNVSSTNPASKAAEGQNSSLSATAAHQPIYDLQKLSLGNQVQIPLNYKVTGEIAGFKTIQEIRTTHPKHAARSFLMIDSHQDLLNLNETQIKDIITFNEQLFQTQGIAGFIFATKEAHENFAAWINSKKDQLQDKHGPIKQPDDQDLQKIRDAICALNPDDNSKYNMLRNISYEENKIKKEARPHIDHAYSVAIFISKGKRTIYLKPEYTDLTQKYKIGSTRTLDGILQINGQNFHDLENPALADYVQELPAQGIFFLGRTLHQKPVGQSDRTSITFYGAEAKNQIPDHLFTKVSKEQFAAIKNLTKPF